MKKPQLKILFFILATWFPGVGVAGTETASFPIGQPIETKMDLGFFGLLGGSMNYTVGGKPISRYEDFKALIYPLRDPEASDLIREAGEAHLTAWMFYGAGTATGIDAALFFKPAPLLNINWFDRIATGVVTAEIFWGIGALFDNNAEGRKYNAIQRYNQLLRKEKESFLDLKPEITMAQGGPKLGLGCDF
jgi:hypothetical protein